MLQEIFGYYTAAMQPYASSQERRSDRLWGVVKVALGALSFFVGALLLASRIGTMSALTTGMAFVVFGSGSLLGGVLAGIRAYRSS